MKQVLIVRNGQRGAIRTLSVDPKVVAFVQRDRSIRAYLQADFTLLGIMTLSFASLS